jgi:type IV pilus assembly protein PilA
MSIGAFLTRCAKSKQGRLNPVLPAIAAIVAFSAPNPSAAQQPIAPNPEAALVTALSAACRQDAAAFANVLTADNAAAFRALPPQQSTAMLKRFVLLEEAGKPLLSTGSGGHSVVRCESPGFTTEMRLGETRLRENLAFVPMEIPISGDSPRSITIGLVREGGNWRVLSVGLMLLDIPEMAKQWGEADVAANEDAAMLDLRAVATALDTYRRAYGKLPDTLGALGPAPPGGVSPEAAGLLDADLAGGNKDGYTIRYTIKPGSGNLTDEEANKAESFTLSATPKEYGKAGRRSFFLDSLGVLRGADKQGSAATTSDPRIGPS